MTINLRELAGRSVLDISSATTIGRVVHGVLDPGRGAVIALRLDKTSGPGTVLPWESIKAIGPDAITVEAADLVREPTGRSEQRAVEGGLDPIGRRVLTDRGVEIGSVVDLRVDDASGSIERVVTSERELDGGAVVGLGDHALIVAEPLR